MVNANLMVWQVGLIDPPPSVPYQHLSIFPFHSTFTEGLREDSDNFIHQI